MITLIQAETNYSAFNLEAKQYPEIMDCINKQFRDCLFAPRLGCQISRDILPFCGRIFSITQFVYSEKNKNDTLFKTWKCVLEYLCQNNGITIERYAVPPTQLNFPLSRAILKGKNVTYDKISFLDITNVTVLEKLIKKAMRFTDQSCGYSVFSEKSLRMMLIAQDTLCAYSTTVQGNITAVVWGVKLVIQETNKNIPCFYILFAAREPEYCGQNIYEKMIEAFHPFLLQDGRFKSEFLCWNQGTNNIINNKALAKFKTKLGEVMRSESKAYTFEPAEECSVRLNPVSTMLPPNNETLEKAIQEYALNAGDFLTFAYEFPLLMFKINWFWNAWYNQTFPTPNNYQTSLQPIQEG